VKRVARQANDQGISNFPRTTITNRAPKTAQVIDQANSCTLLDNNLRDVCYNDFRSSSRVAKDLVESFTRQKHVVLRQCLADDKLSPLYRYARKRATTGANDSYVPGAYSAYGDFFMDGLLLDVLPLAEQLTGAKLFPTYSYLRVYHRGNVLARHTDRPSCEISSSICLGHEAKRPWPIWIEGPEGISSVELAPGDALFYRGIQCAHWREPLTEDLVAQVFLHYVDQNGPNASWKFDKRTSLTGLK